MSHFIYVVLYLSLNVFFLQTCDNKSQQQIFNKDDMLVQNRLLNAVNNGDLTEIKEVLKSNPNLETKDAKGRTSLMIAIYNNRNDIVRILVKAGANVNAQDSMENTPFLYAGADGNLEMVKLFLDNNADFNIYNRYGGTALIPAAERGHVEVVRELVTTPNFPIDHINRLGWTALLEAIILADPGPLQEEIVNLLLHSGSDVNIADREGVTPLQHAKKRSLHNISTKLREAGGH